MFLHAGDHFEDIERYNEITSLIDTFKLSKDCVQKFVVIICTYARYVIFV